MVGGIPLGALVLTGLACVALAAALRRHRDRSHRASARHLAREAALEAVDSGVCIVDEDRRLVYANPIAATVLEGPLEDALGRPIRGLIGVDAVGFDSEDGGGELVRNGTTYELRCSEATDRRGRSIGHTIVFRDVTDRKRRERRVKRQRDELAVVDRLARIIREVDDSQGASLTREDVESRVCERLADTGLYANAWIGRDVLTDGGEAAWTIASDSTDGFDVPVDAPGDVPVDVPLDTTVNSESGADPGSDGRSDDRWISMPIAHDRVVYGRLVVSSDRAEAFGDREREALAELGTRLGNAIDDADRRALLAGEGVLELEFDCTDRRSALVALSGVDGFRGRLRGIVPRRDGEVVVYVDPEPQAPGGKAGFEPGERTGESRGMGTEPTGATDMTDTTDPIDTTDTAGTTGATDTTDTADTTGATDVIDLIETLPGIAAARRIGNGGVEVRLAAGSLVTRFVDAGARVRSVDLEDGGCRVVVDVAPGADVRSLIEAVREAFPDTRLRRKTRRDRQCVDPGPSAPLDGLTDRQREALEVAYRGGYFEWPRESTGEDVAAALGVSPPTLHAHLRKAQKAVIADLFDRDGASRSVPGE